MTDSVVNLTVNNYTLTMKCLPDKDSFKYRWIKKNDVFPSRAQGANTSQLTIVNLKSEDSGDYQCVMSNNTGTISSNFSTVDVKGKSDIHSYCTAQNFDGGNIDEFDEFPAICQYFHYQNFPFSYLPLMNLWQSGSTRNKIIPLRCFRGWLLIFTATAQGLLRFPISHSHCLLVHPIHQM